jgi:glycosyltransferase involved in cell wall biosynthesis
MTVDVQLLRTRYPHWGHHSGIGRFVDFIDRDRYRVRVRLVSDGDDDFPLRNRVLRGGLRHLVQRRGMHWYKLSDLDAELRVMRQCWRHDAVIVHYLDGEHSAQYLPRLLARARRGRTRTIATYHQPPELLDRLLAPEVLSALDRVTVVAPDQYAYFAARVPAERVRLVLHGVDVDYFRPADEPERDGVFRCITVGHYLRDIQAVRRVAAALHRERDIEFHIVSSAAAELAGLPNVRTYRGIDDAALLALYQRSDVLFLPLLGSTANNALLEGIACGLPVVSTQLESVRHYVPGGVAILIDGNDPTQLADAIVRLARNPDERATMGRLARERAETLSWRCIAPHYERMYTELMENGA